MKKFEFIENRLFFMDGAMGSELAWRGMPAGVSPEVWSIEHSDVVMAIQRDYLDAGSDAVLTPTFGANPIKLAHFGVGDQAAEINDKLVALSAEAAKGRAKLFVDLGPTGALMKPMGDVDMEEVIAGYAVQVKAAMKYQPDYFLLETFMDIAEARAAVIAIKENSDVPFIVSMTFDPSGRTLTGATPQAAAILFTALGASAVGCNCSGGPASLSKVVRAMREVTDLPIFAKPNAGIPEVVDGKTVVRISPEEFAEGMEELYAAGASIVGGCCGTNPEHIRALTRRLKTKERPASIGEKPLFLTSQRRQAVLGGKLCVVGERINPTGKKTLQEELADMISDLALDMAMDQFEQGAHVLDVNGGSGKGNEAETLCMLVEEISQASPLPLSLDSASADALIAALRRYAGRAIANSVSLNADTDRLLQAMAFYGAVPILMPMKEGKVPHTAEEKMEIARALLEKAKQYGYTEKNVLFDCAVCPVGVQHDDIPELVLFARQCAQMGWLTIGGISNYSFGMPERARLNASLLTALMANGLTAAIMDPSDEMMDTVAAAELLRGKDEYCEEYLERFH